MASAPRIFDSADMASRGRIGGHSRAARYSPDELTGPARRGFLAKLEAQADPDGTLTEPERARRVEQLRRAHYSRMARKRWQGRRARIARAAAEAAAETAE